jgi:hypothetical protein
MFEVARCGHLGLFCGAKKTGFGIAEPKKSSKTGKRRKIRRFPERKESILRKCLIYGELHSARKLLRALGAERGFAEFTL